MIALLLALQAAAPIHIHGARPLSDSDRVNGHGIVFRCDLPLKGVTVSWQAALNGEVTGVGKGPLILGSDARAPISGFHSYRGMVSYDEKIASDRRPLFLSLNSRQKVAGAAFEGELRFTYAQDGSTVANRLTRAGLVRDASITFFNARDIVSSNGLRFPRQGAKPVASASCTASDRIPQ